MPPVESRQGWEGSLTPFLVPLSGGDPPAPAYLRGETFPILTAPWGPFPSRTKSPSGEAGSNEGESFASTQSVIQPPGLATAVLEGSQPKPTTGYVGQCRQWERQAGGPACGAHLVAFAFILPLVSWGSFAHYIRAWLRPVVTSQRTGWDNRA